MLKWQIVANILIISECFNRDTPPPNGASLLELPDDELRDFYHQLCWDSLKKKTDSSTGELY